MSDVCVAQLVRVVDRQSKDRGSNPGTVESVSFSIEHSKNRLLTVKRFLSLLKDFLLKIGILQMSFLTVKRFCC